ncbi:hypothetical protein ABE099_08720 [Paenibacillus turicensis]|uniref:hypothetical protein n=1 Tax=Paenibacillus turicensis TaxID=160487 RepID=UPI003D269A3F
MAGVAINGSKIAPVIKAGHVKYKIERHIERRCKERDENGNCIDWQEETWVDAGTGSADAIITGTVSIPSSKMKLQGVNVARVDDITIETWEATIPSPPTGYRYDPPQGKVTDKGQGKILSGSSKVNLDGKPIALIGSQVLTCLDTITTIETGNTKMNFSK